MTRSLWDLDDTDSDDIVATQELLSKLIVRQFNPIDLEQKPSKATPEMVLAGFPFGHLTDLSRFRKNPVF